MSQRVSQPAATDRGWRRSTCAAACASCATAAGRAAAVHGGDASVRNPLRRDARRSWLNATHARLVGKAPYHSHRAVLCVRLQSRLSRELRKGALLQAAGGAGPTPAGHVACVATLSGLPRLPGELRLLLPSCADSAASCSACVKRAGASRDGRGEHKISGAQSSRSVSASSSSASASALPKSGTLWQRCAAGGHGAKRHATVRRPAVNSAPPAKHAPAGLAASRA